jgi:hypothetical protein
MKRSIAAALAAVFFVPSIAAAQECQRTSPYADEDIHELALWFYNPEYKENRGTEIQLLTPADTQYVVRDDSICDALVTDALARLRDGPSPWAEGREGNFEATVYRFGPYYVVELMEELPPVTYENGVLDGLVTSRSPTLIYRASDMKLLRSLY